MATDEKPSSSADSRDTGRIASNWKRQPHGRRYGGQVRMADEIDMGLQGLPALAAALDKRALLT